MITPRLTRRFLGLITLVLALSGPNNTPSWAQDPLPSSTCRLVFQFLDKRIRAFRKSVKAATFDEQYEQSIQFVYNNAPWMKLVDALKIAKDLKSHRLASSTQQAKKLARHILLTYVARANRDLSFGEGTRLLLFLGIDHYAHKSGMAKVILNRDPDFVSQFSGREELKELFGDQYFYAAQLLAESDENRLTLASTFPRNLARDEAIFIVIDESEIEIDDALRWIGLTTESSYRDKAIRTIVREELFNNDQGHMLASLVANDSTQVEVINDLLENTGFSEEDRLKLVLIIEPSTARDEVIAEYLNDNQVDSDWTLRWLQAMTSSRLQNEAAQGVVANEEYNTKDALAIVTLISDPQIQENVIDDMLINREISGDLAIQLIGKAPPSAERDERINDYIINQTSEISAEDFEQLKGMIHLPSNIATAIENFRG